MECQQRFLLEFQANWPFSVAVVTEAWLWESMLITGNLTGSSGQLIFSVISHSNWHKKGILVDVTCCQHLSKAALTTLFLEHGYALWLSRDKEPCRESVNKPTIYIYACCKILTQPKRLFLQKPQTSHRHTHWHTVEAEEAGQQSFTADPRSLTWCVAKERSELEWQHVPRRPNAPATAHHRGMLGRRAPSHRHMTAPCCLTHILAPSRHAK